MADGRSITVTVRANIRESLARELREAAEALEPAPPSPTAEDLRGAEAEIDRLNAIIRGDIPDAETPVVVEKIARALCIDDGGKPDERTLEFIDGHYTDKASDPHWTDYVPRARAVLAALAGAR